MLRRSAAVRLAAVRSAPRSALAAATVLVPGLFAGSAGAQQPDLAVIGTPASPSPIVGIPTPWQLWHNTPATPLATDLSGFHWLMVLLMTGVCLTVMALLVYVLVRFTAERHPVPRKTTHNTVVEVIWTVIPVLILVIVAVPSFRLLYALDRVPEDALTVKIIGHQWYWEYRYPDHDDLQVISNMVQDADIGSGQPRALEVDNRLVVPVGQPVRLQITSEDVIHSWGVSSFGFTRDAIAGRLNETWIRVDIPGVYYGHCRELCGINHAYMPIAVEAVPQALFDAWVDGKRAEGS